MPNICFIILCPGVAAHSSRDELYTTLTSSLYIAFRPHSGASDFWFSWTYKLAGNCTKLNSFWPQNLIFITKLTKFTSQYCLVRCRWTDQQHQQRLTQFIAISVSRICWWHLCVYERAKLHFPQIKAVIKCNLAVTNDTREFLLYSLVIYLYLFVERTNCLHTAAVD